MKKILTTIYAFLLAAPLVFAGPTNDAQGTGNGKLDPFDLRDIDPLKSKGIIELLYGIIDNLTKLVAPPVAVLMIIIGAFQMLSAGGDPEKFNTGKKTILYASIGFAILLLARLIIGLVQEILTG